MFSTARPVKKLTRKVVCACKKADAMEEIQDEDSCRSPGMKQARRNDGRLLGEYFIDSTCYESRCAYCQGDDRVLATPASLAIVEADKQRLLILSVFA
jgi:hypothetical protein